MYLEDEATVEVVASTAPEKCLHRVDFMGQMGR